MSAKKPISNEKENIKDNQESIGEVNNEQLEPALLEFDIATIDLQYPIILQTFLAGRMADIVRQYQQGNAAEIKNIYEWCIEQAIKVDKMSTFTKES